MYSTPSFDVMQQHNTTHHTTPHDAMQQQQQQQYVWCESCIVDVDCSIRTRSTAARELSGVIGGIIARRRRRRARSRPGGK